MVVVAFDRLNIFEFGIACEVFGLPRPEVRPWYSFAICAAEPGPLRMLSGLQLDVPRGLRAIDAAGTVIVPGWRDIHERPPEALLRSVRRAAERGARVVSLCSGAFVLAAAGLLDGLRATTHWRYVRELANQYPTIDVDPNVLYVDEGQILTAAGSAAGIDLCLHLVRRDFGAEVANSVARRLVTPPHREGGQAQFIDRPVQQTDENGMAELLEWLGRHLERTHTIAELADRMHMSQRTFARRFREQTGTTPGRWIAQERVRQAQYLLENTDIGVDQLAMQCGFGSAQLLRFHFQRLTNTTPTAYRQSFRGHELRAR